MFGRQLHDYWEPPDTARSRSLIDGIGVAQRAESRAAAQRLRLVAELFETRRAERGEEPDWAVDTWAAVGAEIAAALRISLGMAGSYLHQGLAMLRWPAVAAVFEAGEIDLATYRTIVYRTGLVTDEAAIAEIDGQLAARAPRWPSMTQGRLAREIDRLVGAVDPDAVRRARERARERDVTVWQADDGTADLSARLFATDARLLDKRLDAMAATVCEADPRTKAQRRADSLGALAAGADRLMCRCGAACCPATAVTPAAVVIHVVAEQGTVEGRSERPGYVVDSGELIPAELVRGIADSARLRPLARPDDAAEPGYRPSAGLAAFVRARDLTCRAPGCDRPATQCDIDHTIPFAQGGATHASNTKCLCRFHHLMKTFWGWRDRQLSDGTVIWQLPDGSTYVTMPGSAWLFPALLKPTGASPGPSVPPSPAPTSAGGGDRAAMMPRRRRTRAQDRANAIAAERARNHCRREARRAAMAGALGGAGPAGPDDDPPPF